eukprot:11155554-Lingulodinium_polyedra.AAC.1
MSVLKHHNAIYLAKWRKEYEDSMFGPRAGGCFAVATETPPWPYPPVTIRRKTLKAAVATPA